MARPSEPRVLAVVPARGGSKGLPGKNLRPLAGLPLIEHSLRFAAMCPQIERTIVSTDSEEIAKAARAAGGEVPFIRPGELAQDDSPTWPVLRHALDAVDPEGRLYDLLLLLEPTAPARLPHDLQQALAILGGDPGADGVVGVSEPEFNPVWQCVVVRDGRLEHLVPEGERYRRRQDAPRVLFVNGVLYLWRTAFVRREPESWFSGRLLPLEIDRLRAVSIDESDDLERLAALIAAETVRLPWL